MARHPDWFLRLDAIVEVVSQAERLDWLGRTEIQAIFGCSQRDSIRLLHKFGAAERDNALSLPRTALLTQLQAIRSGSTYAAFLRQRQGVARELSAARAETSARQFRVCPVEQDAPPARFEDLPGTIALSRPVATGPGRLEILYQDGADLMHQLAVFLAVAGVNREEFFAATEASDGSRD
jgi:hypothetical protein